MELGGLLVSEACIGTVDTLYYGLKKMQDAVCSKNKDGDIDHHCSILCAREA